jgi:hypothetical protein
MFSYGFSTISTLIILFINLLYTTTRLISINQAVSRIINLKELVKKLNFGANFFLIIEMVISTIVIIPPLSSPILFLIVSIATVYDIYLFSKGRLQVKFPEVAKNINKIEKRYEIKMWSIIAAIAYMIYLIVAEGNQIKRQRYGKYIH